MALNFRSVIHVLGVLLALNGVFMLFCVPASFVYNPKDIMPLLVSSLATIGIGLLLYFLSRIRNRPTIKRREGFLVVALGWAVMTLSGAVPYMLSGVLPSLHDAFFESMSGYTTTGASVIADLSIVPKDILLWRSLTQWIGGMGIIVLAVAILPVLGIGGMQMFSAEASGITTDKISPRISDTAKRLWYIYVGITLAEIIALRMAGMTWFESINHSFTTVATGGFGTYNSSMGAFSPLIQYIVTVFMILSGVNFLQYYFLLKGKFNRLWANDELWAYLSAIGLFTLLVTTYVAHTTDTHLELAFRNALFMVSSVITSTGFATADYDLWGKPMSMVFFLLLFTGAMAGSTSGGVKMVRHVVLIKNAFLEIRRQLHPNAIIPVRLDGRALSAEVTDQVVSFIIFYILCMVVASLAISFTGVDIQTSMSAVATCMGNIGPGVGGVSPSFTFAWLTPSAKWILSGSMLLGRLELFTVLIIFTPYFWRARG